MVQGEEGCHPTVEMERVGDDKRDEWMFLKKHLLNEEDETEFYIEDSNEE